MFQSFLQKSNQRVQKGFSEVSSEDFPFDTLIIAYNVLKVNYMLLFPAPLMGCATPCCRCCTFPVL